jgi:hypothetical protein
MDSIHKDDTTIGFIFPWFMPHIIIIPLHLFNNKDYVIAKESGLSFPDQLVEYLFDFLDVKLRIFFYF